MKDLIEKARQYILQEPQCKEDIFIILCSLNLLNAAIKEKEYKSSLSYGFIKPNVSHHNSIVCTYVVMVFNLVSTILWKLLK